MVRDTDIGIIGAGQLSQMLVQAGTQLGLSLHVYASSQNDPAVAENGVQTTIGKITELELLRGFLQKVSICGFESELLDFQALREAAAGLPVRFIPSLEAMEQLSEKAEQKRILKNLGIPSAPHVDGPAKSWDLDLWLHEVQERFGTSFVIKWSKFGYDGRGVLVITDPTSLSRARASCRVALTRGIRLYAEALVPFKRELAIIGCHSRNGEFSSYPLVISEQEHGVCRRVRGPATQLGINPRLQELAVQYAEKIAKNLGIHGCFGVEFFETLEGELWVNEIAPRVHNTGHYTQDASPSSQFENHLKALTGQILGATSGEVRFFSMLNLLGPQGLQGHLPQDLSSFPSVPSQVNLHWYNKTDLFPGRKLGHLNCVASSAEELKGKIQVMDQYRLTWEKFLKEGRYSK